jgi:hypothetical protein
MSAYRLVRSDVVLGVVTHDPSQDDFPWQGGVFSPTADFDDVRPLFEEELRLLNADQMDAWIPAWDNIDRVGLRLEPLSGGTPITNVLIHIDGAVAWWRS